jgi:peptidoglycan/xylan/chitin deacetylase (PgdA/CDA1 family)
VIAAAVKTIAEAAGERPVGWHTRSASSVNTRRLLLEEGGFLYDSDCYDDDMPRTIARPDGGRHVILPYAFDTNDMRFGPGGGFVQAEDFSRYCIAAIDWLLRPGCSRSACICVSSAAPRAWRGWRRSWNTLPARPASGSHAGATSPPIG